MAFLLIFLAVVIYSLYPSAVLQFVSGQVDILSYLLVFHLVASAVSIALAFYYQSSVLARNPSLKIEILDPRIVNQRTIRIGLINTVFDILGRGSFFFAIFYGSAVQATVFYELWASVFLLMTMFFRRNQLGQFDHHHGIINTTVFFIMGVIGVVLVVSSHDIVGGTVSTSNANALGGVVLLAAVSAPFLMATSFFFGTKNARIISAQLKHELGAEPVAGHDQMLTRRIDLMAGNYHGLFPRVLGTLLLIAITSALFLLNIWEPRIQHFNTLALLGVIFCALLTTAGATLADLANNLSKSSNLNNFWNFTPFLAVIFLNLFGFSNEASKELYFGAILILSANYILLSKSNYSMSFIASIFSLCAIYFAILFMPPVRETQGLQHVAVPLGIFGIFAALFIDRIVRNFEAASKTPSEKSSINNIALIGQGLFSHYVFILWILGFGSILSMILFRPDSRIDIEFVSAFVAVAVIYICFLPLEYMIHSPNSKKMEQTEESISPWEPVSSLVTSALFIMCLFVLYLLALMKGAALDSL